jgi:hypothetical protein
MRAKAAAWIARWRLSGGPIDDEENPIVELRMLPSIPVEAFEIWDKWAAREKLIFVGEGSCPEYDPHLEAYVDEGAHRSKYHIEWYDPYDRDWKCTGYQHLSSVRKRLTQFWQERERLLWGED